MLQLLNQSLSDLQFLNVNETVYFYFDNSGYYTGGTQGTSGTSGSVFVDPLNLLGTEKYVWNFDAADSTPDKAIQTTIGPDPVNREVSFQNPGPRTVELKIYDAGTSGAVIYDESINFSVYQFASEIIGPEFVQVNQTGNFQTLEGPGDDVTYNWYNNGVLEKSASLDTDSEPHMYSIAFTVNMTRASIKLVMNHGNGTQILQFVCVVSRGNATQGQKYESDVTPKLLFFNKEGDCLNFNYNVYQDDRSQWEGDMIFHVNGDDTFKTQALYIFESVPPVTIDQSSLILDKFQVFNQFGIDFQPTNTIAKTVYNIDKIEAVNNSSDFYTKWVYGNNFHIIFPIGSEVYFENVNYYNITNSTTINTPLSGTAIPDFNSFPGFGIQTFTVLGTKQDAILILTTTNNNVYNSNYASATNFYTYSTTTQIYKTAQGALVNIQPGTIVGLNIIKVFSTDLYLTTPTVDDELNPEWNENGFEYLLYDQKSLTIVNSQFNDGVYNVKFLNSDLTNKLLTKYYKVDCINLLDLMPNPRMGFRIDITFRTTRILLSTNPVDFIPASTLPFLLSKNLIIYEAIPTKDFTPGLLQTGVSFNFEDNGTNNPNFVGTYDCIKVDQILNIVTPNNTDTTGWSIRMYNTDSYSALASLVRFSNFIDTQPLVYDLATRNSYIEMLTLQIVINNISTYNIHFKTIDFNFDNGDMDSLYVFIKNYINTNIKGVGAFVDRDNVRILEFPGYSITTLTMGWQYGFTIKHNVIHSTLLPQYGLAGNAVISLNTSDYNGFVYYRTSTNTVHIFIWDDVNSVAAWYTMGDTKKVVWVETTGSIEYQQSTLGSAYLVDTVLSFYQTGNLSDINLGRDIQAYQFVNAYQSVFANYGLELFINGSDLCITRIQLLNSTSTTEDYSIIGFFALTQAYFTPALPGEITESYPTGLTSGTAGMATYTQLTQEVRFQSVEMFQVATPVIAEKNHFIGLYAALKSISANYQRKIEIFSIDKTFGLIIKINGINYSVAYDDIFDNSLVGYDTIDSTMGNSSESFLLNDLIDIQRILMNFGNQEFTIGQETSSNDSSVGLKYYRELESLGVIIYLERSSFLDPLYSSSGGGAYGERPYDTLVIESKYPNVPVTFSVTGALDYRIKNKEIEFIDIGATMTVSINSVNYTLNNIPSTQSIPDTLELFVTTYAGQLFQIGIIVDHYYLENFPYDRSTSLLFYTLADTTRINITVWTGKNSIPGKETYIINDYAPGNVGIILAGNELATTDTNIDLEAAGLATAMIIAVTGAKFPLNNQEYNIIYLASDRVGLSYQGPFWPSSDDLGTTLPQRVPGFDWELLSEPGTSLVYGTSGTSGLVENLIIKSRQFLRYPREGYMGDTPKKIQARWLDDTDTSMFFYEFTGNQLNVTDHGAYTYVGPTPLFSDSYNLYLNSNPNKDLTKVADPRYQQTVFEDLTYNIEFLDSETDINPQPTPLQIFIGYRGDLEGVNTRTLIIERVEDINITINTEPQDPTRTFLPWVNIMTFDSTTNELTLSSNRGVLTNANNNTYKPYSFLDAGFLIGHLVQINGVDSNSAYNAMSFKNNGFIGEIAIVGINKITFKNTTTLVDEVSYSIIKNPLPPFNQIPAGLSVTIAVVPQQIAQININGQTEIEDDRFLAMFNILGGKILHRDVFIFKDYDIQEAGIDWIFLNEKRKEMLLIRNDIYNYIGSYKAVIHAINYFGYNDVSFNEYYLNIDKTSNNFGKLVKVEIPNIFDNSTPGWNANDYITKTLPNPRFQKTGLFNLTYRLTDTNGNNVLNYTLDEVTIKLLGLKSWLQDQTIPPGKRIKDITGVGEDNQTTYLVHDVRKIMKVKTRQTLSPVVVSRVEVYLQPIVNVGETYNVHIVFGTEDTTTMPDYYHLKISTFAADPDIKTTGYRLAPVQTKNEYRTDLTGYNFTVDRYTDPFILIEIFSDNNYGATFKFRKTYDISNSL
jgi:hypothetical protein